MPFRAISFLRFGGKLNFCNFFLIYTSPCLALACLKARLVEKMVHPYLPTSTRQKFWVREALLWVFPVENSQVIMGSYQKCRKRKAAFGGLLYFLSPSPVSSYFLISYVFFFTIMAAPALWRFPSQRSNHGHCRSNPL